MIIQSLQLLTPDLAATRNFYYALLHVDIIEESSTHISFSFGHSLLTFFETRLTDPFYHVAFSIPNNKLEEAMHWVEEKMPLLHYTELSVIADFKGWNAKAFYFHDSQQNILEFITHYDLHTTSVQSFSAACISGICEIGITVPDVTEACEQLHNHHRIPYFIKGPRFKDFAVMGDEHGMFIVSQTGRGWLPTHRPSEQHWTKVMLENDGERHDFLFE